MGARARARVRMRVCTRACVRVYACVDGCVSMKGLGLDHYAHYIFMMMHGQIIIMTQAHRNYGEKIHNYGTA